MLTPLVLTGCDAEEIIWEIEGLLEGIEDLIEDFSDLSDFDVDADEPYFDHDIAETQDHKGSETTASTEEPEETENRNDNNGAFSLFTYEEISFSYPEEYKNNSSASFSDTMGNNFSVNRMSYNSTIQNMTIDFFKTNALPSIEAEGITVSDITRVERENSNGITVNIISFTSRYISTGINLVMHQSMLLLSTDYYTYQITTTELTPSRPLVEIIYDTLDCTVDMEDPTFPDTVYAGVTLKLRSSASDASENNVVKSVPFGTKLNCISTSGAWYKVRLDGDDTDYYVQKKWTATSNSSFAFTYITLTDIKVETTTTKVVFYDSPFVCDDLESALQNALLGDGLIKTNFEDGYKLTAVATNDGWVKVKLVGTVTYGNKSVTYAEADPGVFYVQMKCFTTGRITGLTSDGSDMGGIG